eukprot:scaffold830_cov377-Prasinococcus_capsulatus_cf.AAC.1
MPDRRASGSQSRSCGRNDWPHGRVSRGRQLPNMPGKAAAPATQERTAVMGGFTRPKVRRPGVTTTSLCVLAKACAAARPPSPSSRPHDAAAADPPAVRPPPP